MDRERLAMLHRRGVVAGLAMLTAARAAPARPDRFISAPDVVLYCDSTLEAASRSLARAFRGGTGVPVRVLAAPGPLQAALIGHGTRTDMLFTQADWMTQAQARRLVDPTTRTGAWRDEIVLAGAPPLAALPNGAGITTLLAGRRLGVIDPVTDGGQDGPALAARLGWHVPTAGEVTGPGVAFLVRSGQAGLGLMQRSAALAAGLPVAAAVPPDLAPPPVYAVAITRRALSRNAAQALAFFGTPQAAGLLRAAGLEAAA
jgi:ABC-type molybdate transport system substrate-binding protein